MRIPSCTTLNRRELFGATCATIASLLCLAHPTSANDELVVVVNRANKETPSFDDLVAIFTTRKQTWDNGKRIVPFNFPPGHVWRIAFDRSVLDMDPDDVARYWIDRRIRGGNSPPKQISNADLVLRLVEKLEGAIGYVPRNAVTDRVRILRSV